MTIIIHSQTESIVSSLEANEDFAPRAYRERMFQRIRDQLIQDQTARNGGFQAQIHRVAFYSHGYRRRVSVGRPKHFPGEALQVFMKIDLSQVSRVVELLMNQRHGLDAA